MITINYDISNDQVARIRIDSGEYTGYEMTTSLKHALEFMSLENPCVTFSQKYRSGELQSAYSETELISIAEAANQLSNLWQYDFLAQPGSKELCAYMSPLQLLENTLNLVIEQQKIIEKLTKSKNGND